MKPILLYKKIGETPLEALMRFKKKNKAYTNARLTYAGRLDPLAEGILIILESPKESEKNKYQNLSKEYVAEILLGVSTDTYDIVGIPKKGIHEVNISDIKKQLLLLRKIKKQTYPPFSSKTIRGIPLFALSRRGGAPQRLPTRSIEVKKIFHIHFSKKRGNTLLKSILKKIDSVKGDFRQKKIKKEWEKILKKDKTTYTVLRVTFAVSSGTYIRGLAHSLGERTRTGACLFSLRRTKVGRYTVKNL